jgi:hypothetical protein
MVTSIVPPLAPPSAIADKAEAPVSPNTSMIAPQQAQQARLQNIIVPLGTLGRLMSVQTQMAPAGMFHAR